MQVKNYTPGISSCISCYCTIDLVTETSKACSTEHITSPMESVVGRRDSGDKATLCDLDTTPWDMQDVFVGRPCSSYGHM